MNHFRTQQKNRLFFLSPERNLPNKLKYIKLPRCKLSFHKQYLSFVENGELKTPLMHYNFYIHADAQLKV